MTEQEAMQKTCPIITKPVSEKIGYIHYALGDTNVPSGITLTHFQTCLGSQCMSWEWASEYCKEHKADGFCKLMEVEYNG